MASKTVVGRFDEYQDQLIRAFQKQPMLLIEPLRVSRILTDQEYSEAVTMEGRDAVTYCCKQLSMKDSKVNRKFLDFLNFNPFLLNLKQQIEVNLCQQAYDVFMTESSRLCRLLSSYILHIAEDLLNLKVISSEVMELVKTVGTTSDKTHRVMTALQNQLRARSIRPMDNMEVFQYFSLICAAFLRQTFYSELLSTTENMLQKCAADIDKLKAEHVYKKETKEEPQKVSDFGSQMYFTSVDDAVSNYTPEKFFSHVKNAMYCDHYPTYNKLPSTNEFVRPSEFIDMVVVKKHQPSDTHDALQDLLQRAHGKPSKDKKIHIELKNVGLIGDDLKPAKRILVEGAPGIGKTTFAWELCKMWKAEVALQKWKVVLMIQLRSSNVVNLEDIFDGNKNVEKNAIACNGKGYFFIFEGYDEANEKQRDESSVFQHILRSKILTEATILVTTRSASQTKLPSEFLERVDQHIELFGFSKERINAYVQAVIDGCQYDRNTKFILRKEIFVFLDSNPYVCSAMFLPLQCAMVMNNLLNSYSEKKDFVAPQSLTEIYTTLVIGLINRYITEYEATPQAKSEITCFDELPSDVDRLLMELSECAAKGLLVRKYSFMESEVPRETMGLMQKLQFSFPNMSSLTQYHFIHATIQEYLAALYWSRRASSQDLQSMLQGESHDLFPLDVLIKEGTASASTDPSSHHWPALMFLAGMTKLKNIVITNALEKFAKKRECPNNNDKDEMAMYKREFSYSFSGSLCSLLYESQNESLIESTFNKLLLSPISKTPTEGFAVGFCIAKTKLNTLWSLPFFEVLSKPEVVDYLIKGMTSNTEKGDCGQIHCFSISGKMQYCGELLKKPEVHKCTEELSQLYLYFDRESGNYDFESTLCRLPQYFPNLRFLNLGTPECKANTLISFFHVLPMFHHLEWLLLHVESPTTIIFEPVQIPHLKRLAFVRCYFPQLAFLNKNMLTFFTLVNCFLSDADFEDVADMIKTSPVISLINITRCRLSAQSWKRIGVAISKTESLRRMILVQCFIGISGAKVLSKAIALNTSLIEVNIYDDSIGEEGAKALAEAIHISKSWRGLFLLEKYEAVFQFQVHCTNRLYFSRDLEEGFRGESFEVNLIAEHFPVTFVSRFTNFLMGFSGDAKGTKDNKEVSLSLINKIQEKCQNLILQNKQATFNVFDTITRNEMILPRLSQKPLERVNSTSDKPRVALFTQSEYTLTMGAENIQIEDICMMSSSKMLPHCVVIEGPVGIGKSMFALYLYQKWCEKEILQEYQIVVFLSYKTKHLVFSKSLKDILYINDEGLHDQLTKFARESLGYRCLIIIDDIEQATTDQRRIDHPLELILRHHSLPRSTVLVMCRSNDTFLLPERFWNYIDQHIHMHGFSNNETMDVLRTCCNKLPRKLDKNPYDVFIDCLKKSKFSLPAISTPLYLEMVVELFSYYWEKGNVTVIELPSTFTQLYMNFMTMVTNKNSSLCSTKVSLDKLAELSKLAAKGLMERKYVFHGCEPDIPVNMLGLMCEVEENWQGSCGLCYHFIYPTVQEFLAAVYFHTEMQRTGELPTFVLGILNSLRSDNDSREFHNWLVLIFLAGLTKSNQLLVHILRLRKEWQRCDAELLDHFSMFLIEFAYEIDNPELSRADDPGSFSVIFHESEFTLKSPQNALEAYLCGYAIAHSHQSASWIIDLDYLSRDQIVAYRNGLSSFPLSCSIKEVNIVTKSNKNSRSFNEMFMQEIMHLIIPFCKSLKLSETFDLPELQEFLRHATQLTEVQYFTENYSLILHISSDNKHPGINTKHDTLSKYFTLLDSSTYTFTFTYTYKNDGDITLLVENVLNVIVSFEKTISNLTISLHHACFPVSIHLPPGNKLKNILLIGGGFRCLQDDGSPEFLTCNNFLNNVCCVGFYWPALIQGNITSITTLTVSCCFIDTEAIALQQYLMDDQCVLQTLNLFCDNETIDEISYVFRSLPKCNHLVHFFYSGKNMKRKGARLLSDILSDEICSIDDVTIIDKTIDGIDVDVLAKILRRKSSLILTLDRKYEEHASEWKKSFNERLHFLP